MTEQPRPVRVQHACSGATCITCELSQRYGLVRSHAGFWFAPNAPGSGQLSDAEARGLLQLTLFEEAA